MKKINSIFYFNLELIFHSIIQKNFSFNSNIIKSPFHNQKIVKKQKFIFSNPLNIIYYYFNK